MPSEPALARRSAGPPKITVSHLLREYSMRRGYPIQMKNTVAGPSGAAGSSGSIVKMEFPESGTHEDQGQQQKSNSNKYSAGNRKRTLKTSSDPETIQGTSYTTKFSYNLIAPVSISHDYVKRGISIEEVKIILKALRNNFGSRFEPLYSSIIKLAMKSIPDSKNSKLKDLLQDYSKAFNSNQRTSSISLTDWNQLLGHYNSKRIESKYKSGDVDVAERKRSERKLVLGVLFRLQSMSLLNVVDVAPSTSSAKSWSHRDDPFQFPFDRPPTPPTPPSSHQIVSVRPPACGSTNASRPSLAHTPASSSNLSTLLTADPAVDVVNDQGGGGGRKANSISTASAHIDPAAEMKNGVQTFVHRLNEECSMPSARRPPPVPPVRFYCAPRVSAARPICTDVSGEWDGCRQMAIGLEDSTVRIFQLWEEGRHGFGTIPFGDHLRQRLKFTGTAYHTIRSSTSADLLCEGSNAASPRDFHYHTDSVFDLSFVNGPDYSHLLSVSGDAKACLLDVSQPDHAAAAEIVYRGHTGPITSVEVSKNHQFFLTASMDATAQLYDFQRREPLRILSSQRGGVDAVSIQERCRLAAIASQDKTVAIWNLSDPKPVRLLPATPGEIEAIAMSPCGYFVATASEDRRLNIWDLRTLGGSGAGKATGNDQKPVSGSSTSAGINNTGGGGGTNGPYRQISSWHSGGKVSFLKFTPGSGGSTLISASYDGTLRELTWRDVESIPSCQTTANGASICSGNFIAENSPRMELITSGGFLCL